MNSDSGQDKSLDSHATYHLAMSSVSTYRWSLAQDIENYIATGYDSIGVLRHKVSDFGEDAAVDLLADSGLHVSSLLWAGGFTGSDGFGYQDALEDAHRAVRLAGALNANCLVVYSGGRNNHIQRHAERLYRSALESLLQFAESADVTLAIEPMHPACAAGWTFLTDVESVVAFIEAIDSPYLRMVFDTYHFGHDLSILCNLREIIPYLALVQLGDHRTAHTIDCERCRLGEGDIPLRDILTELTDGGYCGPYEVELAGREFGPRNYSQLLAESRVQFEALMPTPLNSTL